VYVLVCLCNPQHFFIYLFLCIPARQRVLTSMSLEIDPTRHGRDAAAEGSLSGPGLRDRRRPLDCAPIGVCATRPTEARTPTRQSDAGGPHAARVNFGG
jgi:hypothetical protein